jgi:DNA-binding MarR family transcriptional regulator
MRQSILLAGRIDMSKQKLDRRGWQRLVAAYEASSATQTEFARRRGVSVSALQHWLYRLRQERATTKASVQFVQVEQCNTAMRCSRVEVELPSGIVIRLAEDASGVEIADVVRHVQSFAQC